MPEITYEANTVEIDGQTVELPEDVENVVVHDDVVLVHCEAGELDPRNLLAFDFEGNELWRVMPLRKNEDAGARPVGGIKQTGEFVELGTRPDGHRYKLDVETGEVEHLGWVR